MDHWKQTQSANNARLRAALDKPLAPEKIYLGAEGYFDPWTDLFDDAMIGPHNSDIDDLALDVLRAVQDRTTFQLLNDANRGLAAEIIMHMLAVWLCDYGTSPRGLFPASEEIRGMWGEMIAKWETWYVIQWGD